jgi:hypothetical protein
VNLINKEPPAWRLRDQKCNLVALQWEHPTGTVHGKNLLLKVRPMAKVGHVGNRFLSSAHFQRQCRRSPGESRNLLPNAFSSAPPPAEEKLNLAGFCRPCLRETARRSSGCGSQLRRWKLAAVTKKRLGYDETCIVSETSLEQEFEFKFAVI